MKIQLGQWFSCWGFTFCFILYVLTACTSSKKLSSKQSSLSNIIEQSSIFNQHFTGFVLYDPIAKQQLYAHNEHKYFTPASNTKILTLYTALSFLPDTLPSIRYAIQGEKVFIKGMGDPTLFHPLWPDHPVVRFLTQTDKKIYLVNALLQDDIFGPGWAWDDYQDDYQAEKSNFPLYGNLVCFIPDTVTKLYTVYPHFFQSSWSVKEGNSTVRPISREVSSNIFETHTLVNNEYFIPFKSDYPTIRDLLVDTLKKEIRLVSSSSLDTILQWRILSGVPADTVYAQMMKISDNFIAEQLLLLSDIYLLDSSNTLQTIRMAKEKLFKDVPDPFQWYDGSGLSRYNLITPVTIVYALNKILNQLTLEGIKRIFPTGGIGTLSNWYKGNSSYVYAKTGSLMNNHSLSGFVHTNKGRDLIFSFMHSNYTGSVLPIRMEMQKTLEFIRDHY